VSSNHNLFGEGLLVIWGQSQLLGDLSSYSREFLKVHIDDAKLEILWNISMGKFGVLSDGVFTTKLQGKQLYSAEFFMSYA
jgi:hypothetical protein